MLRDYRPYETPHGGAMPLDESGVIDASYGPAGMVTRGAGYGKDREPLGHSMGHLRLALRVLRYEDFDAWAALIGPYLSDVADSSVVDHWRKLIAELDEENAQVRADNERRRKKGKPPRPEKVRHVFIRLQLERHDRAIEKLARLLRRKRLYVVHPKLMSERERVAGDAANAQIVAYYHRVRVAGRTHRGAVSQTAAKFEMPEEDVEKRLEYAADTKLVTCVEEGCPRAVYSQNLCSKHYQQDLKARKRMAG